MVSLMGILNLTPDSFLASSRYDTLGAAAAMSRMVEEGASIIDIGAVSTRPGAAPVTLGEEWRRLKGLMRIIAKAPDAPRISLDTTRAEIVRRTFDTIGPFIVNDISAGEDDPEMLQTVGELGLSYIAMHKKGDPRTMDALAEYEGGVVEAVLGYFDNFSRIAADYGIEDWILDPGFGFAKTIPQNLELLQRLGEFTRFGRPVLAGIADKRFTRETLPDGREVNRTEEYNALAAREGASILRVHDVARARLSLEQNNIAYA